MKHRRIIFILSIMLPLFLQARNFAQTEGLTGKALQGAQIIDNVDITASDKDVILSEALNLIKEDAMNGDPAACFLRGLIYFQESQRYAMYYDILLDEWSTWYYDPEVADTAYDNSNDFINTDITDIDPTVIQITRLPKTYREFCMEEVIDNFTTSAEKGYAPAMYYLGAIYSSGAYKFDRDLALNYYRSAIERGSAEACGALGKEYFRGGNLVDYDFTEAVKWLTEAMRRGDCSNKTCLYLGYCYENGYGVEKDIRKAVEIYSATPETWELTDLLGYSEGNFSIPFRLGILYYSSPEVQDYNKAFPYLKFIGEQKVREVGDIRGYALRCLSACYRYGRGTAKDEAKADYYLKEAGDFGMIDAAHALQSISPANP